MSDEAPRFHGGVYERHCVLDCNTVYSGRNLGMRIVADVPPKRPKILTMHVVHPKINI